MVDTPAVATSRGRILVADDEEAARFFTKEILQRHGFVCDCAADSREATQLLEAFAYDLLVSDIRMPGNQDLEFIRSVPEIQPGLPVILVTGHPSLPTALQAIQLPVIAYLLKPVDLATLMLQIEKGMAFRRVSATLHDVTDHLRDWVVASDGIRQAFERSPQATVKDTLYGAMTLTIGNVAKTLLDLQGLFKVAMELEHGQVLDTPLPNSPRLEALENALQDGIQVLQTTKDTYRSKELGALRRRFEALLPNLPQPDAQDLRPID